MSLDCGGNSTYVMSTFEVPLILAIQILPQNVDKSYFRTVVL